MSKGDLKDFISSSSRDIEDEYKRIQERTPEDPGNAGDQGEENWATLFRDWLPPTFQVITRGRILSHNNIASPQVDIVILLPEYPKKLIDKKVYLAGGVLAAFECKITLKSTHFKKFFENSIKIKKHSQKRKGTPYKELQAPILYGLLSHSHNWKRENSDPQTNVINNLEKFDKQLIQHPIYMPDIVCVADLATWNSSKISYLQLPDRALTSYICHSKIEDDVVISSKPLGSLISHLLNKIAWEYPSIRNLASYFELSNIQGKGKGHARQWDSTIYSREVRKGLESGKVTNGILWDEWSLGFH